MTIEMYVYAWPAVQPYGSRHNVFCRNLRLAVRDKLLHGELAGKDMRSEWCKVVVTMYAKGKQRPHPPYTDFRDSVMAALIDANITNDKGNVTSLDIRVADGPDVYAGGTIVRVEYDG